MYYNMSESARKFISKKIPTLIHEGYSQKQAVKIAFEMARKVGYKVNHICPRIEKECHSPILPNPYISDEDVAKFVKKYGYASGGDWSGMLMSAIHNASKVDSRFAKLWEEMPDKKYEFLELFELIKQTLSEPTKDLKDNPGAKWHSEKAEEHYKQYSKYGNIGHLAKYSAHKESEQESKKLGINPPEGILIYDTILAIEAKKGSKSLWPKENFRHEFKNSNKAAVIGLKDGSILIKSQNGKHLWKVFNYGPEDLD